MSRLGSRGDTIVEVLIAIAVVSSVLGIAYSIMNRNIVIMRDNQERTEASKLAQGQIERLRLGWASISPGGSNVDDLANTYPTPVDKFCLPEGFPDSQALSFNSDDPSSCLFNQLYTVVITRNNTDRNYLVRVSWDSISGGSSEIVMGYRLR